MILEALLSLAVNTARCESATFDFPATYDAGPQPTISATLDFDGDGLLDLAVGGPNGVVLLRGDGRGGFAARRTLTTEPATELFAVGRNLYAFDSGTVTNLTNGTSITGSGTLVHGHFGANQILFVNENVRAVGDIDGDGNDDLVVLNGSTLTFLRWNGSSFVIAGSATISTPDPGTIVVADFDGDGRNDVGIRSSQIPLLDVYRSHGGFTLDPPLSTHYQRGAFHVVDVTGDGKPDLIGDGPGFASLYRGRGDGTFAAEEPAGWIFAPERVLAVADFNGDGIPDVVALAAGGVMFERGNGNGTFVGPRYAPVYTVLKLADFNNDGRLDILGSDGASTFVSLGQSDGTFKVVAATDPQNPIPSIDRPEIIGVADANGDGALDLFLVTSGGITRWFGNGDGTFRAPRNFAMGSDPQSITLTDLNADGIPDVVLYNGSGALAFTIAFGENDNTYSPPQSLLQKIDAGDRGFIADVNGDGRPDFVDAGTFGVAMAISDGSSIVLAHFTGEQQVAGFIAVVDFDGDKNADLLYDDYHHLTLRAGFGDGTFGPPLILGDPADSYSIGDVNGDGLPDIIAGLTLILNRGHLLFAPPQPFPVAGHWTIIDYDGDGLVDLINEDGLLIRGVCPGQVLPRRRGVRH